MNIKINTNLKVTQKLGENRPKLTNISMLPPFWATVYIYITKKIFEHELSQGIQSELQTVTIMNLMMDKYLGWV